VLLDTTVLVEIFRSPGTSSLFRKIVEEMGDEEAFVSIIQLGEIADWAVRNGIPAKERVDSVEEIALIVPLSQKICLDVAEIKYRRRESRYKDFGLLDGIVLATARSVKQKILTFDTDFEGETDCRVIS
jgi:predicted nucleic acid-binding protein